MNQDIYQKIYRILHDNFSKDEIARTLDEERMFTAIREQSGEINICEYKEEVRQAIIHYYATKGFKAFVFFGNSGTPTIKRKLFDYENNIYVNLFITAFAGIKDEISQDTQSGMLVISGGSLLRFYEFLCDIESVEDQKNIIRSAIKRILELNQRDAIFIGADKITIKRFQSQGATQEVATQVARRSFDHIAEDTLKFILKELEKQGLEEKLKAMVAEATQGELNFTKINNFQFGKNFIKVFQDRLLLLVSSNVSDDNKENLLAYTNFVLRQKFEKILYFLAKELIELILIKNLNAETFLRFYNGDVAFTPDNRRFQKPDIIDETGLRWNSSTIFQVAMLRKKGLEKIKEITEEIAAVEAKIADFAKKIVETKNEITHLREKLVLIEKEFRDFSNRTKELIDEISALKSELANTKEPNKIKQLQELITKKSLEHKKQAKDEELNVREKKKTEGEIEKLEIKEVTLNKDKAAFERKLQLDIVKKNTLIENQKPLDEKHEMTIRAVAKAISSFRGV